MSELTTVWYTQPQILVFSDMYLIFLLTIVVPNIPFAIEALIRSLQFLVNQHWIEIALPRERISQIAGEEEIIYLTNQRENKN